jgi:hypothetical protein
VDCHLDGGSPLENARGSPIGNNGHPDIAIKLSNCQLKRVNPGHGNIFGNEGDWRNMNVVALTFT